MGIHASPMKLKALYILDLRNLDLIYGPQEQAELNRLADFLAPPQTPESVRTDPSLLEEVEVIFSGWGGPILDEAFLSKTPRLKAVFYGAGSVRWMLTPAFWERDIIIINAAEANAIPVAEYCLATILLSMKDFWRTSRKTRLNEGWMKDSQMRRVPGNFRSTVGFISLGAVARKTLELLRPFAIRRLAYSIAWSDGETDELDVEEASLDEIFRHCEVISLHMPSLPETRGIIRGHHFELMKPGATFINTARGPVVNEKEMCEVLARRPDIYAVLDVTDPEPPLPNSPVTQLPNVVLTPHIAGSLGRECHRLGSFMVDEFKLYLRGEPLRHRITRDVFALMA